MEYLISEIVLVLVMMFLMKKLRKFIPKTEELLNGLIVYIPPDDEKISKALANPQQFIINCGQIDEKYAYNSPFFGDSDFLVLLSLFASACVSLGIFFSYIFNFTLNTSSYMTLMIMAVALRGAYLQVKQSGFRNPDNWMGLFFSMALICFSSMLMYLDHQMILNFNFHFSLSYLSLQTTSVLNPYTNFSFSINPLLFSIIYSLFLSLMIFPYFKYLFRSTLNYYATKESPFNIQGIKPVSPLYRYTLVFPFVISLMWVNKLNGFVLEYVKESYWEHFRVGFVMFYSLLRIYQLRTEVQILLDQGKSLIYEIIRTKSVENRQECELQCKAIGAYAWPLAHQSLCYSMMILSLCFLLLCKGDIFKPYPQAVVVEDREKLDKAVEIYDDNEFFYDNTAIVTPSMTVSYYKEIKEIEELIKNTGKSKVADMAVIMERLVNSRYVPSYFYRDCIEYAIWIYHLATVLTILLTMLYKRRFYIKQQKIE